MIFSHDLSPMPSCLLKKLSVILNQYVAKLPYIKVVSIYTTIGNMRDCLFMFFFISSPAQSFNFTFVHRFIKNGLSVLFHLVHLLTMSKTEHLFTCLRASGFLTLNCLFISFAHFSTCFSLSICCSFS